MNHKVDCNILNVVEEDFTTVGEIMYVVQSAFPEDDEGTIVDMTFTSLELLLRTQQIQVYEGVFFNDDETLIPEFAITKEWIRAEVQTERRGEYGPEFQKKFLITPKGREAYGKCKPEYFAWELE